MIRLGCVILHPSAVDPLHLDADQDFYLLVLGLLGKEFSIGPLGKLRECRTSSFLLHVVLNLVLHLGGYGLVTLVGLLD